jgi:hypothetical protein
VIGISMAKLLGTLCAKISYEHNASRTHTEMRLLRHLQAKMTKPGNETQEDMQLFALNALLEVHRIHRPFLPILTWHV